MQNLSAKFITEFASFIYTIILLCKLNSFKQFSQIQTFLGSGGNWSKISFGKSASKHQQTPTEGMLVVNPHLLSCWQSGQSLASYTSNVMNNHLYFFEIDFIIPSIFSEMQHLLERTNNLTVGVNGCGEKKSWKSIESTAI